ncbi:hypothetical protein ALC57_14902 [Trachymyrmex cornetzi]|uniref:Uncharacterized protein n=1 Tax=Trachymyrmex cornetzi TaxID=471704 RepID=A0A195DJ40_9HYME|nr:hypothetical protein ALC57_14902 [Trachymyrmex cornetzi]
MEFVPRASAFVPWHIPLCIFGRKGGKDKKTNGRTVGRATRILVNGLSGGS